MDGSTIFEKIKNRYTDFANYAIAFKKKLDERGPLQEKLKGSTELWEEMN